MKSYAGQSPQAFTFNIATIAMNSLTEVYAGSPNVGIDLWFKLLPYNSTHDKNVYNFFDPKKLVNYIKYGILFTDESHKITKYILRNHQYDAIQAINKRLLEKKNGYVWHTQGSGKTITIASLISSFKKSGLTSTTTIIDVDRNSLVENIHSTIKSIDSSHFLNTEVIVVNSRKQLKEKLSNKKYRGIIIATTQKMDDWGLVSNRDDIVVISDEAHRSHFSDNYYNDVSKKTYLKKMREALPNANYIGFTGTPIFKEDRATFKHFGKMIHKYDMSQAEKDGVITKILYSHFKINLEIYDDSNKTMLKDSKVMNRKDVIALNPERLEIMTNEISKKFQEEENKHKFEDVYKIMVITESRKQGFEVYKLLKKKNPDKKVAFVASSSEARDKGDPELYKFLTQQDNKEVYTKFKDPQNDIQIMVVTNMLQTGYNVRNLRMLFIDKKIKEHNLLQAIARVNRKYKGKNAGYVISFRNLKDKLNEALKAYRSTTNDNSENILIFDSKSNEKFIQKMLLTLKNKYGVNLCNANDKVEFIFNTTSDIRRDLKNKEDIIKILKDIKDHSNLVMDWNDDEIKQASEIACYIFVNLSKSEIRRPFIQISDEEFKDILKSIKVIGHSEYLIRELDLSTINKLEQNKKINDNVKVDCVAKYYTKRIIDKLGISDGVRESVFKQIKKIIEDYNNANISSSSACKKIQEVGERELNHNKKYDKYSQLLIGIITEYYKKNISEKTKKIIDNFLMNQNIEKIFSTINSLSTFKGEIKNLVESNNISNKINEIKDIINSFIMQLKKKMNEKYE